MQNNTKQKKKLNGHVQFYVTLFAFYLGFYVTIIILNYLIYL